ncbi:LTA synthase family protein [Jeotgalibacillus malaysiensis]|uniref:LTA synthase family protein n=1 Tax=Jeotgalibacillus malaysiensis TaxID=1508404 RepID=UPI00384CA8C4
MKKIKGKIPPIVVRLFTLFVMFIVPLITLLISEWIVRRVLLMSIEDWVDQFTVPFIVNYLFILALYNVFFILPRKWFYTSSLIISVLIMVFAVANHFTLEFRAAPITVDDFKLIDELRGFESPVEFNWLLIGSFSIAVIVTFAALLYAMPKLKEWWIVKILVVAASGFFLYTIWYDAPISPMDEAGMQKTMWRLDVGVKNNGLLANFIFLAKTAEIEPLENYSESTIESLHGEYPQVDRENDEQPNVIYLMSEAFIDPYYLGEELYKEDPVPNFRALYNDSISGFMYSSEFGGGTANVEFEALTGFSTQFMRSDHVAYQQFINEPIPSVPYLFKDAGYETTAVHAFYSWYYQRNSIYKHLGFDQFISGEFMDLDQPVEAGGFPEDRHMTDAILETMDYTEGPDFIHAVSVEAHVPYYESAENNFLKDDAISAETQPYLNYYVDKMHSVDQELGRLVEALKQSDEETILVFWGDHLPSFPDGNAVYGANGTKLAKHQMRSYDDFLATHKVPYFIWSTKENHPEKRDISPNFASAMVTDLAGVTGNTVTRLNREIMNEDYNRIPYSEWPDQEEEHSETVENLQMIQYDWLHGNRYQESLSGELNPSSDYHLGLYEEIELVDYTKNEKEHNWVLKGAPKLSAVLINGQRTESFSWQRLENGITSYKIPEDMINSGDEIEFVVYNSRKRELLSSEVFEVE